MRTNKKGLLFLIIMVVSEMFLFSGALAERPTASNGFAGGNGSNENPYIIETPEQLEFFAESTNSGNDYFQQYISLKCDLDFTVYNGDNNHIPIGTGLHPFCGDFNGCGHTIKGIRINNPNNDYQGIFGVVESKNYCPASIGGVCTQQGEIIGRNYVGGIVGAVDSCSWSNSTIMKLINKNNVSGDFNIGGVIGSASGSISLVCIENTGSVKGSNKPNTGNMIGGLIGALKVYKNTAFYNLKSAGDVNGNLFVGGIAGHINSTASLEINSAHIMANIYGNGYVNTIAGLINAPNKNPPIISNSSKQKESVFLFKNDNAFTAKSESEK